VTYKKATDEELDELSFITPEDIKRAQAFVRKYGNALMIALLEAQADENKDA